MGIIRTAKSQLPERFVRVDRRIGTSDGMGGQLNDFVTVQEFAIVRVSAKMFGQ